MSGNRWRRLVALHVGEDLDPRRGEKVERHLAACPSCRDLEIEMRRDLRLLRDLDSAAIEGLELGSVRCAVMVEVADRKSPSPVLTASRLLAVAATAVFVIAVALLVRQGIGPVARRTVSRDVPSPAPAVTEDLGLPVTLPPKPSPEIASEPLKTNTDRLARAETHPPRAATAAPPRLVPAEPITIKILTDDPEVVIYWIVEAKGEKKHV